MESVVSKIKEYVLHRSILSKLFDPDPKQLAKSLVALEVFSDLTITCGDKEWKVHKNLLWIQSDYFRKLLDGDFKVRQEHEEKEKKNKENAVPAIIIILDTPLARNLPRKICFQLTLLSFTSTGSNLHQNRPLPRRPARPRPPNPLLLQLRPPHNPRLRRLRNPPPHPARQNLRHSRQVQRPAPRLPRPLAPGLNLRPSLHHHKYPRVRQLRARRG
jgi:hypothetical protein